MKCKNKISILMLFIIALGIIPLELSFAQNHENASYETYYFLDTGVVPMWKNSSGIWQYGRKPGSDYRDPNNYSLVSIHNQLNGQNVKSDDIELVNVVPYDPNIHSFAQNNFKRWINNKARSEVEYINKFYQRSSNNIRINSKTYDSATGDIKINWNVKLTPNVVFFDVKTTIEQIGVQEVYEYLGGEANVTQEMKKSIEDLMPNKFDPRVEGYFCFVPTVVEYRVKKVSEDNDPKYILSGFNNYSVTRNQVNPHDPRKYTFWMFRPMDAAENLEDEFLVEGHSWTYQGKDYTESKKFPIKYYKVNKENPFLTYEFDADFVPISAVIWRKGVEEEQYMGRDNFKENFWAGYTKQYQGESYYYYATWDAQADGEFYPWTLLDDYIDSVVQQFLNPLGYTSKELWQQEPWKN